MADQDPVADYLRTVPGSDRLRAAAWDAAYAPDDAEAEQRLRALQVSDEVKAKLWELRAPASAQPAPEAKGIGTHVLDAAKSFGGTVFGAVDSLGRALIPEVAGEAIGLGKTGPVNALNSMLGAQADTLKTAKENYDQGDTTRAVANTLYGLIPGIGPGLAHAAEEGRAGNYGTMVGETAGNAAVAVGPKPIARAATDVATRVAPKAAAKTATALEAGAASRYADVMAPKVGANKQRFGNTAERVAPELAKDPSMAAWTREGLHEAVSGKLVEAEAALDAASAGRNAKAVYDTAPIVKGLKAKLNELTSQSADIGIVKKVGEDVIPAPKAARAAQLRQAIDEITRLGPVASFDALKNIRQAYDGPAKAIYNPSMTADFLARQGEKLGAADVTGVLREKLAGYDQTTAAANAQYSLYRAADDVLEATREVERTRPKVGRQIITRLMTTTVGAQSGGVAGAAGGFVLAPVLDTALSSGLTTKLQTAQAMAKLAQAIRRGDVGAVNGLTDALTRVAKRSVATSGRVPASPPVPTTADAGER
jgi:tetrahydromethanopterin S-methyltransferase subunit F